MTKADRVHSTPQTAAPAEHLLEKLARLQDEASRATGALPVLSASVISS